MIYEHQVISHIQTFESGLSLLESFWQKVSFLETKNIHASCWVPPPHGVYKFNIDRAIFIEIHKGGVGFILRYWEENALIATSINESNVENLATVVSLAILWGPQH